MRQMLDQKTINKKRERRLAARRAVALHGTRNPKETIMPATQTRTYVKHNAAKIAKKALKLGGKNIKGAQLGDYAVLRAAVREKIITPTNKREHTGKRGRPATLYTLTLKGRNLAKRA